MELVRKDVRKLIRGAADQGSRVEERRWSVEIETPEGVITDADTLVRFRECLEEILGMTGAAASTNTRTGILHASFTVTAANAETAAEVGLAAFRDALAASGLAPVEPVRVAVERVGAGETIPA